MTHTFLYDRIPDYPLLSIKGLLPLSTPPASLSIPHALPFNGTLLPVAELAGMPFSGRRCDRMLSALTELSLPNSLVFIGQNAMRSTPLRSVHFPPRLRGIGNYAFSDCTRLGSVALPDSLSLLGIGAFQGSAFEGLNLGNGIKRISKACFMDSNALRFISELPPQTEVIGEYAFSNADGALLGMPPTCISLSIPPIKEVGAYAFAENPWLSTVSAHDHTWSLLLSAPGVFSCSGINEVRIPAGTHTIANEACFKCSNITRLSFPDSLQEIGEIAFNSTGITSIVLPPSVTKIGPAAFAHNSLCTKIIASDEQWPLLVADRQIAGTGIEEVCLPSTVESIGAEAFAGCTRLLRAVIPESVSLCHDSAFNGCTALQSICFLTRAVSAVAFPWRAPSAAVWHVRPQLVAPLKALAAEMGANVKIEPLPAEMLTGAAAPATDTATDNAKSSTTVRFGNCNATIAIRVKVLPQHLHMLKSQSSANILMARYLCTRTDAIKEVYPTSMPRFWHQRDIKSVECISPEYETHNIPFGSIGTLPAQNPATPIEKGATYLTLKTIRQVSLECEIPNSWPIKAHQLHFAPSRTDGGIDLTAIYYGGKRFPTKLTFRTPILPKSFLIIDKDGQCQLLPDDAPSTAPFTVTAPLDTLPQSALTLP